MTWVNRVGNLADIGQWAFRGCDICAIVQVVKRPEQQVFFTWLRISVKHVFRLSERTGHLQIYRQGCYNNILVTKIHIPYIWEFSANKKLQTMVYVVSDVRWAVFHRVLKCMCGVRQNSSTDLNNWSLQWEGLSYSVGGIFRCVLGIIKSHCKSLSYDESIVMRVFSSRLEKLFSGSINY